MKLSLFDQLIIGFWLSAATGLGIWSRSAEAAAATLVVGAFGVTPMFAGRGIKSQLLAVRSISAALLAAWLVLFLVGLFSTIERLYYVNAASYPSWLASGELSPAQTLETLRANECKGRGPLEISEKADGQFLVRCGFMWYDSKTYISHTNPMEEPQ